jgi:hypothetical protein
MKTRSLQADLCSESFSSVLDFSLVDFGTGFVDHDNASARAAVVKVDGDLMGNLVGGFPGVVLVLAIEPDRVLETNGVGNIKMKNGHLNSSSGVNAPRLNPFRNSVGLSWIEIIDRAKVPALGRFYRHTRSDLSAVAQRANAEATVSPPQ